MMSASALPIIGIACCNLGMLQGLELKSALDVAIALKKKLPGLSTYGPTALGKALGMKQPSASELMKYGRISKGRYFQLVEAFSDVVGPEHWGLPFNAKEYALVLAFRALPSGAQDKLLEKIQKAAEASLAIDVDLPSSEVPRRKQEKAA